MSFRVLETANTVTFPAKYRPTGCLAAYTVLHRSCVDISWEVQGDGYQVLSIQGGSIHQSKGAVLDRALGGLPHLQHDLSSCIDASVLLYRQYNITLM